MGTSFPIKASSYSVESLRFVIVRDLVYVLSGQNFNSAYIHDPRLTGSKDRLHRAKTIDLCQNPLTVRIYVLNVWNSVSC